MANMTLEERLALQGGYRTSSRIVDDESEALSAGSDLAKPHHSFAPIVPGTDERLKRQIAHSFWQSTQARDNTNLDEATRKVYAYGYQNEAFSYQRLRDDISENMDADRMIEAEPQSHMAVGMNGRIPDAVLRYTNKHNVPKMRVREMKTRSLTDSLPQLNDLAGAPAGNVQFTWRGGTAAAPLSRIELEMRTSSKDLTPETMQELDTLSTLATQSGRKLRIRTNSMTTFQPIAVVQQRRAEHGV